MIPFFLILPEPNLIASAKADKRTQLAIASWRTGKFTELAMKQK